MSIWPSKSKDLAKDLHSQLTINDLDWHKLKGNSDRRAAELLSAAISQLLNDGELEDVESLVTQSIKWLKREIKDYGCPHRKN